MHHLKEGQYDLFVSHAIEDKTSIANALTKALLQQGLRVWYSGQHLVLGQSVTHTINQGLLGSSYGLVLISPAFLSSRWTMKELEAMVSMETCGEIEILPVWHEVDFDTVRQTLPTLADKFALRTSIGIEPLVKQIAQRVLPTTSSKHEARPAPRSVPVAHQDHYYQDNHINALKQSTIAQSGAVALHNNVVVNGTYVAGRDMVLGSAAMASSMVSH